MNKKDRCIQIPLVPESLRRQIGDRSPKSWVASLGLKAQRSFLSRLSSTQKMMLEYQWRCWLARPSQLPPPGDGWSVWLIMTGRAWGKTRAGAEYVRMQVEEYNMRYIALVAATEADARNVMVEGQSGLLNIYPPQQRPVFEPSKRKITWPNGAIATIYSASEPSQLRGPQHDLAWCDEPAKWSNAVETWDNLEMGLRLGQRPRIVATTTPRPVKLIRRLVKDPMTVITRGTTFENAENLPVEYLDWMRRQHGGTWLGRQELNGELLDDFPGALWTHAQLEQARRTVCPQLRRIVIGVDPAVTASEDSDETGIVVAGLGEDEHYYVLADVSCRATPNGWAQIVASAREQYKVDRVIAESNNGGQLVEEVLRTVSRNLPIRLVHASHGKFTRAEPIQSLYEQGRVHHVRLFPELEDQMCAFVQGEINGSSDRVDALVWALTALSEGWAEPRIRSLRDDILPMPPHGLSLRWNFQR